MISPAQRRLLVAFVDSALSGKVAPTAISWANQNQPASTGPWCRINVVSSRTTSGMHGEFPVYEEGPPEVKKLRTRVEEEVVLDIQVGSRLSDSAPAHADRADDILETLRVRLFSPSRTYAMRAGGLVPLRVGDMVDVSAVANGSQWETRASLTVTFGRATIDEETDTSTIESAGISGTLDPVSGTVSKDPIGP